MSADFDFSASTRPTRRTATSYGALFLTQFLANLLAFIVGGLILLFCLRSYIRWSVMDTAEKMKPEIQKSLFEQSDAIKGGIDTMNRDRDRTTPKK